jgi:hypothetical protein
MRFISGQCANSMGELRSRTTNLRHPAQGHRDQRIRKTMYTARLITPRAIIRVRAHAAKRLDGNAKHLPKNL